MIGLWKAQPFGGSSSPDQPFGFAQGDTKLDGAQGMAFRGLKRDPRTASSEFPSTTLRTGPRACHGAQDEAHSVPVTTNDY